MTESFDNEHLAQQILNEEIARELLTEHDPKITDADIEKVFSIMDSPWDAVSLYILLKTK